MSKFLDEHFVLIPVDANGPGKPRPLIPTTATCRECDRVFDLTDTNDAEEWSFGHDCEA